MRYLGTILGVLACAVISAAAAATELNPLSDAFIERINSKQTTWKAGKNFPHNTSLKHMKRLLGVLPKSSKISKLPTVKHDASLKASLPDSFDARIKWPNCPSLHEIRDQGSCGSCWAFSAVEVMTDRVCIYSNGTKHFHFSAEDLISCCTDCGFGCHGGDPSEAWYYWQKEGIVSGGNYNSSQGCKPYTIAPCVHHAPGYKVNATGDIVPCPDMYGDTPKCMNACDENYDEAYKKDKQYGKKVFEINGEEDIMAELFLNGPVGAAFLVYLDFYTYKSGVYYPIEGDLVGGHAAKIIGWGVENDTKYWLVANSWNSYWGDNGFFKMRRGKNDCEIESVYNAAGEPLLDDE